MNSISYIDAHCHLTDSRLQEVGEVLITRAQSAGVARLMIGGVEPEEWLRQIRLKSAYPGLIRTSFGLHPWKVEEKTLDGIQKDLGILETLAIRADAIGETGLDFHPNRDPLRFEDQRRAFRAQIRIAKQNQKPLVLHVVSAHAEAREVLTEEAFRGPMLVHSFSGGVEDVRAWISMGAFLSYSGVILKPGYKRVKEALLETPLDHLLLETDSPDQSWKKKLNEPAFIPELYAEVARLLAVDSGELSRKVDANFDKIR